MVIWKHVYRLNDQYTIFRKTTFYYLIILWGNFRSSANQIFEKTLNKIKNK